MSIGEKLRVAFDRVRGTTLIASALAGCFLFAITIGCDTVPTDLSEGTLDSSETNAKETESALSSALFETFQPDHTKIKLSFHGDEHFNWYEDVDGYTVVLDSGAYRYAALDEDGELAPTVWLVGKDDPEVGGLTPGILPTQETIDRIRSESTVKPIVFNEPNADELRNEYVVIEGDMVVSADQYEQAKRRASGSVYLTTNLWTNGIVPYEFDANVTSGNQALMRQAMDDWEAVADVHFVPRTNQANYLHIFSGSGNWSYVGMIGGRQDVSIYNWGWEFIMAHELAHALGFWHEQSRSDRNTYVQINTANIQSGKEHNFNMHNSVNDSDLGAYDFDSVMHYGPYAFTSNGQPTITALPPNQSVSFGQRTHLSLGDTTNMGTVYGSAVPPDPAEMTSPSNNATLSGASVTFQWDSGTGVSQYRLWVGTTQGGNDLYNQSTGTTQSATVSGLPTDGSTVYVRLNSYVSSGWQSNDYTYTASTVASQAAAITSPSNNATLSGASVTFQWNSGTGVSQYRLWVGTTQGGNNLYNQSTGTTQSATVSGLPTDGSTVYVRLNSYANGSWQHNNYSYTAATVASQAAAMTSPSNNATLSGASVTFQWNSGTGVSQYRLWVGTTQGGNDLYNQSTGTTQSATVSGLPTDGSTVYVRLNSYANGSWQHNNYSYTAATVASQAAAMTSPSNNATLSGASVTFQWNSGTGVSQYRLWVGTTQGGNNLYNQSTGTTQSATVSGLPTDGSTVYVRLNSYANGSWQHNNYSYTAATVASQAAAITSPSNNATLSGASVTFQWNSGTGVSQYRLWVGTTQGGKDLYNQSTGTTQSATVSGLPTDGSTVYVRLNSYANGSWQHNNYSYTAATVASQAAAITSPSNNATLSGASVTFQWNSGTGVSQYRLWVGTTQGGNDLYNQSTGTTQSATVSGLPTDGSTVYVRLNSYINGSWQNNEYSYTASN